MNSLLQVVCNRTRIWHSSAHTHVLCTMYYVPMYKVLCVHRTCSLLYSSTSYYVHHTYVYCVTRVDHSRGMQYTDVRENMSHARCARVDVCFVSPLIPDHTYIFSSANMVLFYT